MSTPGIALPGLRSLPDFPFAPPAEQVDAAERQLIVGALRQCEGNVARAAKLLLTPKKTLCDKLARHAIDAEAYRRQPPGQAKPTP